MTDVEDNDAVKMYLRELGGVPPLTKDEENALLEHVRIQDEDAEYAGKRLIETHLAMVVSIAERHCSAGLNMIDLIQEGNIGLFLAISTFLECVGESFSEHAARCVEDAIRNCVREHG
jgi:RNA polymerase primary sigma factor